MSNEQRISEFLTKAGVYYLATVNGNVPKCRPLGFHMLIDGTIYFGVGDFKEVYRQLQENPMAEICATIKNDFIRYYGKAVFIEDNEELLEKAFEVLPMMKKIYNEESGYKLKLFKLVDATVEYRAIIKLVEKIEL